MDIVIKKNGILWYDVNKAADYDHKGFIRDTLRVEVLGNLQHIFHEIVMYPIGQAPTVLLQAMYLDGSSIHEDVNAARARIEEAAGINFRKEKEVPYARDTGVEISYCYDPTNDHD